MECLLGIRFDKFIMIAADMTNAQSIVVMKNEENKIYEMTDRIVMGINGESGDTTQFAEYIAKNIQLYKMRNGYSVSTVSAANFTRRNLADALRSRNAYHVNMLIGGHDKEGGPQLYFMDYLGACVSLPYACHGYGGFFSLSIMDRYYRSDMSQEEAYAIIKRCISEIHKRLIINLPNFKVVVVDENGIKYLPIITPKDLD
uniref:Proteasome subunit beta n=1 Tax=Xenopsylla cheopis TaxID=163159 RepID=A2IAA2_XENCH|nr:proteasome beta 2 subunit-like protein [Xenopsylla cheopis]